MSRQRRSFTELKAGWAPFGFGQVKPGHYRDLLRVAFQNRDSLGYAWKVLQRGVCDGCVAGSVGSIDPTLGRLHFCTPRLDQLRLNTVGPMRDEGLARVAELAGRTAGELAAMGRLAWPLRWRRGEPGYERVSSREVWAELGPRWGALDPQRTALHLASQGLTNETHYVAQKVARFLGSNHVDSTGHTAQAASAAALRASLGVTAATCSYADWLQTDVLVLFGSNPATEQPAVLESLARSRRNGARVLVVNTCREPGLERVWIPSRLGSALFGTRLSDRFFLVKPGGDLAFVNAVQKVMLANGWHRPEFVEAATSGFSALQRSLDTQPMDALLARCGLALSEVHAFARELAGAERGVFVWSKGITEQPQGRDTVAALVNLALLREYVGRPGTGCMPMRGTTEAGGALEMGATPDALPGGVPLDADSALRFSALWGFGVPAVPGRTTSESLQEAARGRLDGLISVGGRLPHGVDALGALAHVPLRVHTGLVPTPEMLVEPADTAWVLPARTRYEQRDGGTETTTERRVIFSPHIPGHQVGEARSEWDLLLDLARAARPDRPRAVLHEDGDGDDVRQDIARAVPCYARIAELRRAGDMFQWGGEQLCAERRFARPDGRARLVPVAPADLRRPEDPERFALGRRRGRSGYSLVQRARDPLTGAQRDHVFINASDAARLGLAADDPITVSGPAGEFAGRAFLADVAPGTVQAHWPEIGVLLERADASCTSPEVTLARRRIDDR